MDLGWPLTPQQKQIAGATRDSHRWVCLDVAGVDSPTLRRRLEAQLHRHQALRLRYERPAGATGLRQRDGVHVRLDWREARPADGQDFDTLLRAARRHCQAQGPDVLAWRLDDHLLLALPVCSLDTRSLEQLRLALLDDGAEQGEVMQYGDYVEWLGALAQDEDAAQGLQFWRNLNLGQLPGMRLVERYGMASGVHARCQRPLDAELATALAAVAGAEGLPVEAYLLAAWGALLARLNGQSQAQLGLQHDPRDDYEEFQGACGLFEQTLPMTLQLSAHSHWSGLVRQLAAQLDSAVLWQEHLGQAQLLPEWRASLEAGLQVSRPARLDACQALDTLSASHLQLQVALAGQGGARLALAFDTGLYREVQAERLLQRFALWLRRLLEAPTAPLASIDALLDGEQVALRGAPLADADPDIVACLRRHAAQQPERPALRDGQRLWSYAELDRLSDQVAGNLIRAGVRPGHLVGLHLARGGEVLIALLGCFKAGAAYLPLDIQQPPLRLAQILADARPQLVLHGDEPSPSFVGARLDWAEAIRPGAPLDATLAGDAKHLAYVLYTSGSGGLPKGVQVEQAQLRHYAAQACEALQLPRGGHYGLVSSLLADLGNTVLFPAWLQGGCVHLFDQATVTDAQAFAEALARHPLDVLKIVPSHLEALMGQQPQRVLPRQVLVLGGEAVGDTLLERLRQAAPGCRLYNHYGPTETTVGVLLGSLEAGCTALDRVLGDNRIHLLDEALRPVAGGQVGELYVAGASVARGYVGGVSGGFIDDPFEGGRGYRTGDLALRQADGALRLLGRNDQQVKIRGFRLDVSEVERALSEQPGVGQVSVLLEGQGDQARLLAFIVEQAEQAQGEAQRRQALARHLPEYMLPAAIVALKALPLTANGKLDRQRLLEQARRRLQREHVAPAGELEAAILGVWSRVLGSDELGVTDNFFSVGGHSLAAIKVIVLIREELGIDLPTQLLFERQTVRELARGVAGTEGGEATWTCLAEAADTAPVLLLVHGAQGHLLAYRPLVERLRGQVAIHGLQAPAHGWARGDALEAMLDGYLATLPAALRERPLHLLGWSLATRLALLLVPRLQAAGVRVASLTVLDHDPQRDLAGEGDECGQLLADLAFHGQARGHALDAATLERLGALLQGYDYAEGVRRVLADDELRERFGWQAQDGLADYLGRYRAIKRRLYEASLPRVDVPLRVVRGHVHGDLRRPWQALSQAQVQVLDLDVGHHAMLADPRLADVVLEQVGAVRAEAVSIP